MKRQMPKVIQKQLLVFILVITMVAQLLPAFRMNAYAAVYPSSLVNGGFEDPRFTGPNSGGWWVNYNPPVEGNETFGWKTTATTEPKFEFGGIWNVPAWGVQYIPEGRQFIELNPTEASAVYQDLSTVPGTVIYWSLYQGGVWYQNSQNINNSMAVRIGHKDHLNESTMKSLQETAYDQIWTNRVIYNISDMTEVSSIPAAYSGKDSNKKVLYTEPRRWTKYEGVYVVPEGQTVTRFSFASLSTTPTQGNLLDGVVFRLATPEEVEELDSKPPVISAVRGNPTSWTSINPTIDFSVTDDESSVSSVVVTGSISGVKPVAKAGSTYSFVATQNETYTITATDHANNTSTSEVEVTYITQTMNITFDRQGGTGGGDSKSVAFGATYGELPSPARTGYTFSGWWTAVTGGTEVTSSTRVTMGSEHILYARWTANPSPVYNGVKTSEGSTRYDVGTGIVIDEGITIDYGENISEASVLIRNLKTGDKLIYSAIHGISGAYNGTTGILTLKGNATAQNYEEALRSVQFSTTSSNKDKRIIDFVVGSGLYFSGTGNFYEYVSVPSSITWSDAKTAAESRSFFGRQGYLVTITSAQENEFVLSKTLGVGWMGARDINRHVTTGGYISGGPRNGDWRWVTGPEGLQDHGKGLKFYGGYSGYSASAVPGVYNNWASGEPNNTGGNEWLVHILGKNPPFGAPGQWNDFPLSTPSAVGYIVEYGGLPSDSPMNVQDSKEVIISTPQVMTVHFDRQGGTGGEDSKSVTLLDTYGALPSPTRAGYTFSGWWTAVTGGSEVTSTTRVTIGSDHTLYARWTASSDTGYTVEHYKQDLTGTGYTLSETVKLTGTTGTTVAASANIYVGFSVNATYESRIASGAVASDGSLVLKLYYDRNIYKVTFNDHDGAALKTETVRHGGNAVAPSNPIRAGYTFAGWSGTFMNVTSPTTITATYTVNSYTMTFDSGEGSDVAHITQDFNTEVKAPENPVREGYTFTGWAPEVPEKMPAEDMTHVANWSINSYELTVNYVMNDGSAGPKPYKEIFEFGGSYSVTSPIVTGYTPSSAQVEGTMGAKNLSVTVTYAPKSDTAYKVEHYIKSLDGSWVLVHTENLTGTTNTEAVASLKSYSGFSQPESAPKANVQADGTTVIRVEYTRNSYTMIFDSGEGSDVAPITQEFNTEVMTPENPVREGYTFTEWTPEVPEKMPAEDMTHVANWSINSYELTINYVTNDGSTAPKPYKEIFEFGGSYSVTSPIVTGYTPSSAQVEGAMGAQNLSVTVTYGPNSDTAYKVEHYTENLDGSWVLVHTESLTGTTNTEAVASLKSYRGFSQPETAPKAIIHADGTTVIRVEYTRNSYTMTFDSGEGSELAPITQEFNTEVKTPENPVREGYTFTGWAPEVPEKMPSEDMTLVANWSINSYELTVSYVTKDGSTAPKPYKEIFEFGGSYSVTSPIVTGYTPSSAQVEGAMGAKNLSVTVTYAPKSDTAYKVEHYIKSLDGSWVLVHTENLTGTTNTEAVASLKSYSGFSQPESAPKANVQADGTTVIRVEYTRNSYTMIFDSGEGSDVASITQEFDAEVKTPENPVREGYTFTEWTPEVPEKMPSEDMTHVANWSINSYELTINYVTKDGSTAPKSYKETLEYGGSYSVTSPIVTGYTPSSAQVEGAMGAQNLSVTVTYGPNSDTAYKVEHYTENLDGSWVLVHTESLTGTTNTEAVASLKSYRGFSQPESAPKANVQADGTTVIRVEYTRNSYTMTFDSGEGSDVASITQEFDAEVKAPENPVRKGYDFIGWYQDEEMTKSWSFTEDKMPIGGITLHAGWTARTDTVYKVKHYREDLSGIYVEFEEENILGTTDRTVSGVKKTYLGFTYNDEHEERVLTGTVHGDETLILKLYYDRNEYRVVFNGFDEQAVFDQMMKFEAVITLPEPPIQEGYLFKEWAPEVPEKVGAEDITLDSLWEITTLELIKQKINSLPQLQGIHIEDGDLLKEISLLMKTLSKEELKSLDAELLKRYHESSTDYVHQLTTDHKTKVSVKASGTTYFDPNLQLVVEEIAMKSFKEEADKNLVSIRRGKELLRAYDISLLLNDVKVQPNGFIMISLPISKEIKGNYKNLEVVYIAEDGEIRVMPSKIVGEYLVFETDHLSDYSIIGARIDVLPSLGEKIDYRVFGYLLLMTGAIAYGSSKKKKTA